MIPSTCQLPNRQAKQVSSKLLTDALPALTVPSFLKTGGSLLILSNVVVFGCSSTLNSSSPFLDLSIMGAISCSNLPSSFASFHLLYRKWKLCYMLTHKEIRWHMKRYVDIRRDTLTYEGICWHMKKYSPMCRDMLTQEYICLDLLRHLKHCC